MAFELSVCLYGAMVITQVPYNIPFKVLSTLTSLRYPGLSTPIVPRSNDNTSALRNLRLQHNNISSRISSSAHSRDIPEVPEALVELLNVEILNELVVSDHGSDSDDLSQIIDKSSVVGSDELPKGVESEQRIRNDWEFDVGSTSWATIRTRIEVVLSTLKVPGRLTIYPDASAFEVQRNMSAILPAKRRFNFLPY